MLNQTDRQKLPVIPLRGLVVFPSMTLNFDIGRQKSIEALNSAVERNLSVFLVPQRSAAVLVPGLSDMLSVGTVVKIKQINKLSGETVRVVVQGQYRAEIEDFEDADGFFSALAVPAKPFLAEENVFLAYKKQALGSLEEFKKLDARVNEEAIQPAEAAETAEDFVNYVSSILVHSEKDRQKLLKEMNEETRLELLCQILRNEIELVKLDRKISGKVKKSIDRSQKEYYLREQMKAISEELGDGSDEIEEYKKKILALGMPGELEEKVLKELNRLTKMPQSSPEAATVRTYCDWICDLPWSERTEDETDLKAAIEILEADHFGLEKVKERIIEYIAVNRMNKANKGPILCFVGPPGVGKTSIAKSIARSLGRKFVRMSLGGVRDEAEIRGHRRTYIGSIPGRILYHMKSAGTVNPVFLLDEIDKMSSDFRGDPASALLEVLDPEQNNAFRDHFIELPYDLSNVMFICTANTADTIPAPLLDRMEIINLTGYTEDEKVEIAKKYLIKKQEKEHGLPLGSVVISDVTLRSIIAQYTRESGVRSLEKQLAAICRKAVRRIVEDGASADKTIVTYDNLASYLGVPLFHDDILSAADEVGTATGLAWTAVGGTTLTIEVSLVPGKGEIVLTGKLGEVMKESARTALSLVKSRAKEWNIDPAIFLNNDIHIHVPEGAIPKDGPSAGITIATAILSAVTSFPVSRSVAMTGEVTLRGRVLPIGGLKEKTLAAHRMGIRTVIIPRDNEKDVTELPEKIKRDMKLILTDNINTVFEHSIIANQYPSE